MKNIKVKLIMLGDTYTGKSAILERYNYNTFSTISQSTIGVDFCKSTISKENCNYSLYIWDTSGQEKFNSIVISYYRTVGAIILVFDISNKSSFLNLNKWIQNIYHYANDNVIIKLIGNKSDKKREVSVNEINVFCNNNNLEYFEVSAKENVNIDNIFNSIVDEIHYKLDNLILIPNKRNGITVYDNMVISDKINLKKKKNKCCTYL